MLGENRALRSRLKSQANTEQITRTAQSGVDSTNTRVSGCVFKLVNLRVARIRGEMGRNRDRYRLHRECCKPCQERQTTTCKYTPPGTGSIRNFHDLIFHPGALVALNLLKLAYIAEGKCKFIELTSAVSHAGYSKATSAGDTKTK